MLFNSISFLLFFPAVCICYYLLPHRFRWALLLAASCLFYMAFVPEYILLCAGIILLDYCTGLLLTRLSGRARTAVLVLSLLLSFAPLFYYKYFNFFRAGLSAGARLLGLSYSPAVLDILLPIGISFLTFQSFGYCIDVYRGRQAAERRPHIFALFVLFFPQLVAGPIERSGELLPQFDEVHTLTAENLTLGLRRMLWGFFKKMVVADTLAQTVNAVYGAPEKFGSAWLVLATVFFALQIYCDFSGYSDIAVGAARVLGFRLSENFDRPYLSASVPEFWRRWHISLSGWFRDYLYIPLGGSRRGSVRSALNLLITFAVSGLWHGAGMTFVVWGLLNGLYQVLSKTTRRAREGLVRLLRLDRAPRLHKAIAVLLTFALITLSWVFFRADSLASALGILRGMLPGSLAPSALLHGGYPTLWQETAFGLFGLSVLLCGELLPRGGRLVRAFRAHRPLRFLVYLFLCIVILGLGVRNVETQFIYFQF